VAEVIASLKLKLRRYGCTDLPGAFNLAYAIEHLELVRENLTHPPSDELKTMGFGERIVVQSSLVPDDLSAG